MCLFHLSYLAVNYMMQFLIMLRNIYLHPFGKFFSFLKEITCRTLLRKIIVFSTSFHRKCSILFTLIRGHRQVSYNVDRRKQKRSHILLTQACISLVNKTNWFIPMWVHNKYKAEWQWKSCFSLSSQEQLSKYVKTRIQRMSLVVGTFCS